MLDELDDHERRLLGTMGFAFMGLIGSLTLSSIWFDRAGLFPVPPAPVGLIIREAQIVRVIGTSTRPVPREATTRGGGDAGTPMTILVTREYPRVSFEVIDGPRLRDLALPAMAELSLPGDSAGALARAAEGPNNGSTVQVAGVRVNGEVLVDADRNYRLHRAERRSRAIWGWLFLGGGLASLAVLVRAGRKFVRG
jgi:hypothetical protein